MTFNPNNVAATLTDIVNLHDHDEFDKAVSVTIQMARDIEEWLQGKVDVKNVNITFEETGLNVAYWLESTDQVGRTFGYHDGVFIGWDEGFSPDSFFSDQLKDSTGDFRVLLQNLRRVLDDEVFATLRWFAAFYTTAPHELFDVWYTSERTNDLAIMRMLLDPTLGKSPLITSLLFNHAVVDADALQVAFA